MGTKKIVTKRSWNKQGGPPKKSFVHYTPPAPAKVENPSLPAPEGNDEFSPSLADLVALTGLHLNDKYSVPNKMFAEVALKALHSTALRFGTRITEIIDGTVPQLPPEAIRYVVERVVSLAESRSEGKLDDGGHGFLLQFPYDETPVKPGGQGTVQEGVLVHVRNGEISFFTFARHRLNPAVSGVVARMPDEGGPKIEDGVQTEDAAVLLHSQWRRVQDKKGVFLYGAVQGDAVRLDPKNVGIGSDEIFLRICDENPIAPDEHRRILTALMERHGRETFQSLLPKDRPARIEEMRAPLSNQLFIEAPESGSGENPDFGRFMLRIRTVAGEPRTFYLPDEPVAYGESSFSTVFRALFGLYLSFDPELTRVTKPKDDSDGLSHARRIATYRQRIKQGKFPRIVHSEVAINPEGMEKLLALRNAKEPAAPIPPVDSPPPSAPPVAAVAPSAQALQARYETRLPDLARALVETSRGDYPNQAFEGEPYALGQAENLNGPDYLQRIGALLAGDHAKPEGNLFTWGESLPGAIGNLFGGVPPEDMYAALAAMDLWPWQERPIWIEGPNVNAGVQVRPHDSSVTRTGYLVERVGEAFRVHMMELYNPEPGHEVPLWPVISEGQQARPFATILLTRRGARFENETQIEGVMDRLDVAGIPDADRIITYGLDPVARFLGPLLLVMGRSDLARALLPRSVPRDPSPFQATGQELAARAERPGATELTEALLPTDLKDVGLTHRLQTVPSPNSPSSFLEQGDEPPDPKYTVVTAHPRGFWTSWGGLERIDASGRQWELTGNSVQGPHGELLLVILIIGEHLREVSTGTGDVAGAARELTLPGKKGSPPRPASSTITAASAPAPEKLEA